jgi:hypothetical protein
MTCKLDVEHVRDYRACWDPQEVVQVLDALDRVGQRATGNQSNQRRQFERQPYLTPVLIAQNRKIRLPDGSRAMFHVMGRNLSQSGLGLLSPLLFEPEIPCREAPTLRGVNIFRDGVLVEVGLRKACGNTLWLSATVVRSRTVQHDFLDVGLHFNARLDVMNELKLELAS